MIKLPNTWQFQEAKNKLSEVANRALTEGPQLVTRHGRPEFYIIDAKKFDEDKKPKMTLIEALVNSPCKDIDLSIDRSKETMRDIDL